MTLYQCTILKAKAYRMANILLQPATQPHSFMTLYLLQQMKVLFSWLLQQKSQSSRLPLSYKNMHLILHYDSTNCTACV